MKEHVIINRLTIQTLSNIQAAAKLHLYTHTLTHIRTQYMQKTKPNCRLSAAAAAGVAVGNRQKSKTQTNIAKKWKQKWKHAEKTRRWNKKQVTSNKNNKLISKIKFTSKATTKTHAAQRSQHQHQRQRRCAALPSLQVWQRGEHDERTFAHYHIFCSQPSDPTKQLNSQTATQSARATTTTTVTTATKEATTNRHNEATRKTKAKSDKWNNKRA